MPGKKIGYKRVSTLEQNPDSQLMGIELDKIYIDHESGYSTKNRIQLNNLIDYVREDDIVYVECLDRLGRSSDDLDKIVEIFLKKGVEIKFVREGIILGKKNDIMSKLSFDLLKAFINFYSKLAKERQREGIQRAKLEGKYKGKKTKLNPLMIVQIEEKIKTRDSKNKIAKELGISRDCLYRYLKQLKLNEYIDSTKSGTRIHRKDHQSATDTQC